jgi:hypothetical protein
MSNNDKLRGLINTSTEGPSQRKALHMLLDMIEAQTQTIAAQDARIHALELRAGLVVSEALESAEDDLSYTAKMTGIDGLVHIINVNSNHSKAYCGQSHFVPFSIADRPTCSLCESRYVFGDEVPVPNTAEGALRFKVGDLVVVTNPMPSALVFKGQIGAIASIKDQPYFNAHTADYLVQFDGNEHTVFFDSELAPAPTPPSSNGGTVTATLTYDPDNLPLPDDGTWPEEPVRSVSMMAPSEVRAMDAQGDVLTASERLALGKLADGWYFDNKNFWHRPDGSRIDLPENERFLTRHTVNDLISSGYVTSKATNNRWRITEAGRKALDGAR